MWHKLESFCRVRKAVPSARFCALQLSTNDLLASILDYPSIALLSVTVDISRESVASHRLLPGLLRSMIPLCCNG